MKKPLPRYLHGFLADYPYAVLLAAAPKTVGFAEEQKKVQHCRSVSAAVMGLNLLTRYEAGLVRVAPGSALRATLRRQAVPLRSSPMLYRYLPGGLLAALLLGAQPAVAQFPLEHRYSGQVSVTRLSTGDWRYYHLDLSAGQVRVYDLSHALSRQISLPALGGYSPSSVYSVSDALFDVNPATLEAVVTYYPQTSGQPYRTLVLRDNGTTVAQLDSVNYAYAVQTSAGAKLIAGINFFTGTTYISASRVYGLPGRVAMGVRNPNDYSVAAERAAPYPNPTADALHLPYSVAAGQTATLTVRDAAGREVRQFRVDGAFPELLLDGRTLAPGTYSYTVTTPGGAPVAGRPFVVVR